MNTIETKRHAPARLIPGAKGLERVRVEYGMWWPRGAQQRPHFSITGVLEMKAGNHRWYARGFGCLHDEIAKAHPKLAELIPFHLWDDNGTPGHYVANGVWYFEHATGERKTPDYDKHDPVERLADHLLVDVLDDRSTMEFLIRIRSSKEGFAGWLESRIPRMKAAFDAMMMKHGVEMINTNNMTM